MRTRANAKASVASCLPNPTLDFRESVDPSTQEITYAKVMIFGLPVSSQPEDMVGFKSNRQFFACGERSLIGSGLQCSEDKKDGVARLAQLQAGGMQFDSGMDQEQMTGALDGVITYVMHAMSILSNKGKKGNWAHLHDCDDGFWVDCTKSKACTKFGGRNWGVVDEHVFTNTEIEAPGGGLALIVTKVPSGTPMYGGSVCVSHKTLTRCLQYAVPQELVTTNAPVTLDDGKTKVDPATNEFWDFAPHREKVAIFLKSAAGKTEGMLAQARNMASHMLSGDEDKKDANAKCLTGQVSASVRYFFDKKITAAWMETKASWAENKCAGAEIK